MAIEFEIHVHNGKVKIRVSDGHNIATTSGGTSPGDPPLDSGGGTPKSGAAHPRGGTSPGDPPLDSGGGTPGSHGCCAPIVIGPIVINGLGVSGNYGQKDGGTSPGDPPLDSGGGTPKSGAVNPRGGTSPGDPPLDSGGGTPGGHGCRAPIVIGPIVINGCCSDDSASSSTPLPVVDPHPVSIDPPVTTEARSLVATDSTLVMEKQEQTNWCWSAVAVSIHNFLDPKVSNLVPAWTQGLLATKLLTAGGGSMNCTLPKDASTVCNQPGPLDTALTITGNLSKGGFLENCYLSYESLQKWVTAKLPVCARIVWKEGGAHFVALDGTAISGAGLQLVHVQDPDPKVAPSFWDYESLVEHYRDLGLWQDTYLVTK
jgi:hypothetical protein